MNQASVIPAPHILIHLLADPDPSVRQTAIHFLVDLLQADDPLTRWGTVTYLLHTSMRFYLDALLERLQEKDQSEPMRKWAVRMHSVRLGSFPASPALILLVYQRLRFFLYLIADLQRYQPKTHA